MEAGIDDDEAINGSAEADVVGIQNIAKNYIKNCKIGHINANSIAGFKLYEIKQWLTQGLFDILVISETKVNETFPNSHFHVDGFRFVRRDRDIHGGGIMMYIRSDIIYENITQKTNQRTGVEFLACKVKIGKEWIMIIGVYKPPSLKQVKWKLELQHLFEMATNITNNVIILGDFNCDLLQPDKSPKDGRTLLDLMDVFHLVNLIKNPTRITSNSETLIDLILTNNKRKILTSGVFDAQISDHLLVYAILRMTTPRFNSRKVSTRSFKNFDKNAFQRDLQNAPFHIMDIFYEVDDKVYVLDTLYSDVANEHAPIKQFHLRGNQVPFMSEKWRKAIRYRNMLWKKFIRNRTMCIMRYIKNKEI